MKKPDPTPFDRYRLPPRQNLLLMPLIWLICWVLTRRGRLKIRKTRMEGLKPPFLVLANHQAFMDFYVTPLALFPYRANYVSELEGFENFGEWIYREVGCLGTRKFVNDIALIRNIKRVTDRGDILVLYPEARYANVGTHSALPATTAKLAKMLGVPLVTLRMHGNYLQSPIWNVKTRGGVRLEAELTQLFTREELAAATPHEVWDKAQRALAYDEYAWQREKSMRIPYSKRAEGLELVLYQCPECGQEFKMESRGAALFCAACGGRWQMDELGALHMEGGGNGSFSHIPDWYEWERKQVEAEIDAGRYRLSAPVAVEALPGAAGFLPLGEGLLEHGPEGFALTFTDIDEDAPKTLRFSPASTPSIHTEYDYRGKRGQCVTLSTLDNTYFLFPLGPGRFPHGFNPTKIQFATEHLFSLGRESRHIPLFRGMPTPLE